MENFCCLRGKEIGSEKEKKKWTPVLVLHRIPAKHMECVYLRLSPVLVMYLWTQSFAITLAGWQQAWTQSFLHPSVLCFSKEKANVKKVLKANQFPCLTHRHTHSCDMITGMNGWRGRRRRREKKQLFILLALHLQVKPWMSNYS